MNWYTLQVFPRLMEGSLTSSEITALRRDLLADVQGHILEIGIGGGLNLACYPSHVHQVTAVDVRPQLLQTAAERAAKTSIQVDFHPISAEQLPFAEAQFDSVVSTWTICSIPNPALALAEIHRVLKPGGTLYFLEHGLSPNPWVHFWQEILNPIQKAIAAGCHLNRDIPALIQQANLRIVDVKTFYTRDLLRTHSYSFQGHAQKELSQ